jgi:hypothetical protein
VCRRRDDRGLCGLRCWDGADCLHRLYGIQGLVIGTTDYYRNAEGEEEAARTQLQNANVGNNYKEDESPRVANRTCLLHLTETVAALQI